VRLQPSEPQNALELFITETLGSVKKPLRNSSGGYVERKEVGHIFST